MWLHSNFYSCLSIKIFSSKLYIQGTRYLNCIINFSRVNRFRKALTHFPPLSSSFLRHFLPPFVNAYLFCVTSIALSRYVGWSTLSPSFLLPYFPANHHYSIYLSRIYVIPRNYVLPDSAFKERKGVLTVLVSLQRRLEASSDIFFLECRCVVEATKTISILSL